MSKLYFVLGFTFSLLLMNDAYGQYSYVQDTTGLPYALLQLIIRDSEGRLVSYIEANQIVAIDSTVLDEYLDDVPDKKIITKDNTSYEIIQWQGKTEIINKKHAMTLFVLYVPVNNSYQTALELLHNSYQVEPNDTVEVYWTITRAVD
jgi:hypothetical protein